jgi:uncharacterized protein
MTQPASFQLSALPEDYAILKFPVQSAVPAWATMGSFHSVTRTSEELSVVTALAHIPPELLENLANRWRVFKVCGPFALNEVGVLAALAAPLANAGVSVFVVSTYDTDYLLVNEKQFETAVSAWSRSGQRVSGRI